MTKFKGESRCLRYSNQGGYAIRSPRVCEKKAKLVDEILAKRVLGEVAEEELKKWEELRSYLVEEQKKQQEMTAELECERPDGVDLNQWWKRKPRPTPAGKKIRRATKK